MKVYRLGNGNKKALSESTPGFYIYYGAEGGI